jgi:hypothetical protein
MPNFTGTLNSNEIFGAIYNMIISQQVFADNIKGTFSSLVDSARVDGSLYGDQKLYYSTDALKTKAWGNDAEASNLLALHRPAAPRVQSIVLDKFRQISLTVDYYLSKRAWSTEGAFSEFTSVMIGWMRDTKRIYDSTLYNAFFGSNETSVGKQMRQVDLQSASAGDPLYGLSGLEKEKMEAMLIAQNLADLFVEMKDVSRDFNDYGHLRSYGDEEIKVVWNSKFVNKIRKIDLPTIFHKDGLVDKFAEDILPARYFGTVITSSNLSDYSASTPTTGKPINSSTGAYTPGSNHANGCVRALVEKEGTVSGTAFHVFPGDEIPAGATIIASTGDFLPGEIYIEKADVICKIVTMLPPMMSAFEVGTSFSNLKSLTENHYLTWGHNSLEHLKGKPFITVKALA